MNTIGQVIVAKPRRTYTAILCLILAASQSALAVTFSVTDLGTLDGSLSYAYGINNAGQIVGEGTIAGDTTFRGAFWSNASSSAIALDTLGGSGSQAFAINSSGQIVGRAGTDSEQYHAAFWNDSSAAAIDLGTYGGTESFAYGINSTGQIVGLAWTTGNAAHRPAFWASSSNAPIDVGTLGGTDAFLYGINDSGQIVGEAQRTNGNFRAAFWNNSSTAAIDLGTLGGATSVAHAINNSGQIAGHASVTNFVRHAAFWNNSSSAPIDLGTLGGSQSEALAINTAGQVVGSSTTTGDAATHAAFWNSKSEPAINLNNRIPTNSGWNLVIAYGINDYGRIVGWGEIAGAQHAFLLTPIRGPRDILTGLYIELTTVSESISSPSDLSKLNDAISHLNNALLSINWLDDSHPVPGARGEEVFQQDKKSVTRLRELRNSNQSGIPPSEFQQHIDTLVGTVEDLPTLAIDEAVERNGNPSKINKAISELQKGNAEATKDHPENAIEHYKNSWKIAVAS